MYKLEKIMVREENTDEKTTVAVLRQPKGEK